MPREIPYRMSRVAWKEIVKDGQKRGHQPSPTDFRVDTYTMTGMMWYHGKAWLFPVWEKK